MIKLVFFALIIGFSLSATLFAQDKTVINDQKARQMLLGRHKLSLQWISWDYFGSATVMNRGGVNYLKGEQKGRGRSSTDFVRVDGVITSIVGTQPFK